MSKFPGPNSSTGVLSQLSLLFGVLYIAWLISPYLAACLLAGGAFLVIKNFAEEERARKQQIKKIVEDIKRRDLKRKSTK